VRTGSCSSLNSPEELTPSQSFSTAVREIHRGRARVCWRGARGQELRRGPAARIDADVDRLRVGVW
jgi:hypothetical protein